MKKLLSLFVVMVLVVSSIVAQAPEKFTYQAVVRNANNSLVINSQISVRVNILKGSATGNAVYSESHVTNSNANGLITVNIGGGTVLHGSFVEINWADGPYFLKTDIDPNGGSNYTITSVQQLLSVPYALYAKSAANGFSGDYNDLTNTPQIPAIPQNVSAFTNDAGYLTGYTEVDPQYNAWNKDYNDLINKPVIPVVPTDVSAFNNDVGYITMDSVPSIPANVSAFQNDARYITMDSVPAIPTVPTNVSAFQNDAGYITQAAVPTNVSAFQNDARYITMDSVPAIPTVPTNVSAFQNDAGYITQAAVPTNVSQLQNDAGYLTNFTEQQILSISNDTIYLTGGSFVKLPTAEGFSGSYNDLTDKPNLFSGNYNDLTGKPNLFSGDYNDLSNRPQIPQIPQNVSAFNNDAGYITMDSVPSIPANVSAFQNDARYITMDSVPAIPTVPTNVSAFQNDAGYITQAAVPTNVSQLQNDAGYLTNFTEQQILSISNDTIYLTGGSFVKLPTAEGFSGSYNDLTDKPNLFSGNYDDLTGKPNLFSGDYNDLSNRPQIPQIPQNVSAFNNDAGYITMDSVPAIPTVPTNVSAFQNDAGYITMDSVPAIPNVPTNVSAFNNDAGYLTGYTETQNLANVTAQGNFAGNQQLKEVADPTDAQDAVTLRYLMGQLSAFSVAFQHQLDSLGRVISAQQAIIAEQQAFIDSVRNNGGDTTPVTPTTFNCGDNLVVGDYSYTTYQYGSQCWMTENLRSGSGSYQFDWPAVLTSCPTGWHMPDNSDWGTLGTNLPSSSVPFGDGDYWTSDLIPWADNEGNTFSYISPTIVQSTRVTLNGDGIACEVHDALQGDCSVSGSLISVRCVRDASGSTTQAPTVTTDSATSVTENAATLNATITNPDNVTITSKGFEYKVSGSIVDTMVEGVGNGGNFTANITGLLAGTEYTCRAYIVYDNQTIYGSEMTFTTNAATPTAFNCGDNLVIGDFSYTTHQYGSQCWMTENLRSASGNYQFGWPGVLEACPAGWHMPNNNDWGTLGANLPSSSVPFGDGDYWTSDIIPWADNEGNSFTLITPTIVQSTSVTLGGNGIACEVHDALQGYCSVSGSLISVRCVREASGSTSQAPTVTTDSATSVTENAATLNATVTNPDNVTITSKGFEYKVSGSVVDTMVEGVGNGGIFTADITGLLAGTEYTCRAYIVYDNQTIYGSEVTFTTNAATPTTFNCGDNLVVGDYSYTTYQYGSQCWMTENLRSASGSYQFDWPGVLTSCPTGWHMPDNSDWGTLGANLPSSSVPFGDGEYWTSDLIPWADNGGNSFTLITPTIVQSTNVALNGNGNACEVHAALQGYCSVSGSGYVISVRCVQDASGSTSQAPTVTTDSATSVTEVSATLNGTLSNPDNVTITDLGFEWKVTDGGSYTSVTATATDSTMSYSLTGLTPSTGYTYRAFITTASGTSYGSEVTFTTSDTSANSLIMPDPCSVDTNTTWHPILSPGSTLCVGADSVVLTLYNHQNGGIQWQFSTDTISWYNIPGAIEPQLTYKPEQTQFVRAVVSYENCPPEYSPVRLLQMSPSANAGISRTANVGDTLNLCANMVEGATGNWQILQGTSGFLSAPNAAYTRFSGTDTLYRLRWTLTNGCGSNSDDIDVRFVRTVVSDRVVMVDTTDIIFSDSAQMAQGYYEISFSDPNIVIGDSTILVSLINGGFMRMVDSWSMANDSTYAMQTSQASLFDILESGVIQFDAIPAAENADNTAQNEPTRQNVEYLDHIPTRNELRSNPNMTKSGTVYLMRMDVEDNNGNRVNMLRGNSRRGDSDDDRPKRMELECGDIDLAPDFEYKIDSAHFHLELNPVFAYEKENRHFRFGLYGANFSVGADIVPKFTPVELEITPIEFTFIKSPKIAFAVPVGPIVIPFTVDYGASVEVKGTIGASMEARYRFNAEATFTYGVNYWGRYNDFTIDKGFDGKCDMGRVGEVNLEGSLELEASLSGYGNLRLAGIVGPRVKAGYKFKIKECAGGSNEAHILGEQGKLTSELFLKLDLKGIKLVDKIIPKNWSKEWTLPVGKKHVFPDTVCRYSSNNLNARASSLVKVKVLGSGGKPSRNAIVIFRPQDGDTVVPSSARTDANGIAQARWEPGQNSDVHQLYAYVYDCEQKPIKGAPVVFTAYEFEGCATSSLELKYLVTGNTLTLQAEGGRPPYTYSVNGGNFVSLDRLPVLSALSGHVLSVKDDFGCIRTITYGHIDNMNCAWSDLGLDAEYSNGALILQGIEGTPPYKYSLDGNEFITSNMFPSLSPGVYTAYVRDYAGCEYSREVTVEEDEIIDLTPIALQACTDAPTVTDYDGNIYNTVQIGEQCWMRENLRTTHYSNGTAIPLGGSNASSIAPYYYDHTLSSIALDQRGYHYNWPAAMHGASSSNATPSGVQGICPTGWHLPSDAEWTQLTNYVRSHSEYTCGGSSDNIAKALASTTGWNLATGMSSSISSCEVGNNLSANNSTGFSAVPSGSWNNGFSNAGYFAYFWSSTEYDATGVSLRRLGFNLANVNRNYFDKNGGLSVRCLRNGSGYATHAPTVTTDSVTSLAATSATLNGSITNPDSVPITAQGFEWKAADSGSYTQVSATGSTMSYVLTGLTPATTYTYRAFVTTGFGTTYGSEVSFTTTTTSAAFTCGTSKVADVDGNMYNTIQLGYQCWMKENLRTTHYADGTSIPVGGSNSSDANPYYYDYTSSNFALTERGLLYNWPAVMHGSASSGANPSGVQGVCPMGWHLPSDAEWSQMIDCVSCRPRCRCDNSDGQSIAKALSSSIGWDSSPNTCAVGNTPENNNATGFSILPAGYYEYRSYGNSGNRAYFWTATDANRRTIEYNYAKVSGWHSPKQYGYSVRCVRDDSGIAVQAPTMTTRSVTDVTQTSAILNATIVNPDNVPIEDYGFEWKTTIGGTYTQVFVSDSTMSYALAGLTAGIGYTYRAFVTSVFGIIYGDEMTFTTVGGSSAQNVQTCPGTPTVTDYDGNTYNTVQIGQQCWMRENLRTTHYADGTSIPYSSNNNLTDPYNPDPYYYGDDFFFAPSTALMGHGLRYNWPAVMHGTASSNANPSGVQGVCPTGWHVPSDAEWTQLTDYVSSQSEYICDSNSANIAKALASTSGWNTTTNNCAVGNDLSANNATGFDAFPAGEGMSENNDYGKEAHFWSCTKCRASETYNLVLYHTGSIMYRSCTYWFNGYSVRCLRDESQAPTVTTGNVSSLEVTSATLNGSIANPNNVPITAQGFEWKATDGGNYTQVSATGSTISYTLTGLTPATTYTYRAFVTTTFDTIYGNEVNFTTTTSSADFTCGMSSVMDADSNIYNTVQIGSQCWMKENLRTTRYADGSAIEAGTSSSTTTPCRYAPDNNESNVATYGYLYNWPAVMHGEIPSSANPSGVHGICPNGWHVPSYAEWTQLTDYVSSQSEYVCGGNNRYIAKALASTTNWRSSSGTCVVGNDLPSNNVTGFSALPASSYSGSYNALGYHTRFWSATQNGESTAYIRSFYYSNAYIDGYTSNMLYAYSVRCVRDENGGSGADTTQTTQYTVPTVTTGTVSNITETTATFGGNITADGGARVTVYGVCWGTSTNPTVDGNHTAAVTGTWNFTANLTGLTPYTTYHVRAYATNSEGTAYGEEVTFSTRAEGDALPCPNVPTMTDIDGNTYNTVLIGNQCWMRENLRTTHYADGTSIPVGGNNTSGTDPYYYDYTSSNIALTERGLLYNWPALMHGSVSSGANPSGVQGVCPTGWHVPSDAEWTRLTDYVSGQDSYFCGETSSYIAKALASTTGWSSHPYVSCAVDNDPTANNATGFSALPAGTYYTACTNSGIEAFFWSATEYTVNAASAYHRSFYNGSAEVSEYGRTISKSYGCSVRCVRD